MPYDDYDDLDTEVLEAELAELTDDDDDDDEETLPEAYDPEFLGTVLTGGLTKLVPAVARAFRRRPRTGRGRGYSTHIRGTRGGRIRTPAGTARFQLPKSVVTENELKVALAKVGKDIRKNAQAIRSTDKKYEALNAAQNKTITKKLDALKQQAMLSMFMQPKLESITFKSDASMHPGEALAVETTKSEDNMMLMFAMMGMSEGDSSSNMMMALAMSKAFD